MRYCLEFYCVSAQNQHSEARRSADLTPDGRDFFQARSSALTSRVSRARVSRDPCADELYYSCGHVTMLSLFSRCLKIEYDLYIYF
jgi:hypothetical protein